MEWDTFILFVFMNIIPSQAYQGVRYMDEMGDRNSFMNYKGIQRVPRYLDDLPRSPKMIPGHTLLKPSRGMLKSAVKFPLRDVTNSAVYGNLDNLGITYGNRGERIRYTDFRKANNLLSLIMDLSEDINKKPGDKEDAAMIVIEANPLENGNLQFETGSSINNIAQLSEEENNANEILDVMDEDLSEQLDEIKNLRRRTKRKRKKYRKRSSSDSSDTSDSSSGSSDFEKNPGNPYSVHKNKYIQNWLWNHEMDGDHMNINPSAPSAYNMGPTGAQLFFARKWWYFNQDDYKPLR